MSKILPNRSRAKNAILCFYFFIFAEIIIISISLGGYFAAEDLSTLVLRLGFSSLFFLVLYIIAGTLFLLWFYRAYSNLHEIVPQEMSYSKGWSIGSWFVPFLNLIRPKEIMDEIVYETQKNTFGKENIESINTIPYWWGFWIVGLFLTRLLNRLEEKATDVTSIKMYLLATAFEALIHIVALYLLINIIKKVSEYEEEMRKSRRANSPTTI